MFEAYADIFGHADGGFSGPNSEAYQNLAKTLQAGSGAGFSSTGARALIFEDLENTLVSTTFGDKQFANTLWNMIKGHAEEANGIMHEFNRLTAYGETGAFSPELTDTLNPTDVDLERAYAQVRFLRNKRRVSKVLRFTKNQKSPEALQVMGATRFLISSAEAAFYEGDSDMVPDEWNGLKKIATTGGRVTDKKGAKLTRDDLSQGALEITQNFGIPSHLFHPLEVQKALDDTLEGQSDRIVLWQGNGTPPNQVPIGYGANGVGGGNNAAMRGLPTAGFRSSFGDIMFRPHLFSRLRPKPYKPNVNGVPTEIATSPNAPATPTNAAAVAAAQVGGFTGTGTGGALTAGKYSGSYAGTYHYRISAVNSNGESIPCAAVNATCTADQKITVSWDKMANATCYNVYRSRNGGGAADVQLIARVVQPVGAGPVQYVDINQKIAGCFTVYMLDLESDGEGKTVGWAQLAPMGRDNLPPGDTHFQWIQFLFGVLMIYAPLKLQVYENVGLYA